MTLLETGFNASKVAIFKEGEFDWSIRLELFFKYSIGEIICLQYRKNMWMTVGSMCVALSTLCFFLLLNTSAQKAAYIVAVSSHFFTSLFCIR